MDLSTLLLECPHSMADFPQRVVQESKVEVTRSCMTWPQEQHFISSLLSHRLHRSVLPRAGEDYTKV